MAFDETAAARVRRAFPAGSAIAETRMMGALVFMLDGHMCCGVTGANLMVRVGPEARPAALAEAHVVEMEIGGGRRPRGFVEVEPAGFAGDADLSGWVARGIAFVATLPARTDRGQAVAERSARRKPA